MKKVELRPMEDTKYKIIKNLVDNEGNKFRAAEILNLSIRQINRLILKYKTSGKSSFVHGNRDRKPVNTIDSDIKEKIVNLYQNKYINFNFSHFKDMLELNEGMYYSYPFIYRVLSSVGIYSPRLRKTTKMKIKEKTKLEKMEIKDMEKIRTIESSKLKLPENSHSRKPRCNRFGEIVEFDATKEPWFNENKVTLHGGIDNNSGRVVGLFFDKEETLYGYYNVLDQILTKYGIPYEILADNRTVFKYAGLKNKNLENDTFTQFGYACHQLGIVLETTSVPEKKPHIERLWNTLHDRLAKELKLAGITNITDANNFLIGFMERFNERFASDIYYTTSLFEKVDRTTIDNALSIITKRKFDRGCCISYNNKYYEAYRFDHRMNYCKGTECIVIKTRNGSLLCNVDNVLSELIEVPKYRNYSENFDLTKPKKEKRGKYIPPLTHPWKQESFLEYLCKSKLHKNDAYNW